MLLAGAGVARIIQKMKHANFAGKFFIPLCLLVLWFAGAAATAAEVKPQPLRMTVSADRRSARIGVPVDCTAVTIQRLQPGGWVNVLTTAAAPGVLEVALPDLGQRPRLRAIAAANVFERSRKKFPAAFYRGKNQFAPGKIAAGATPAGIYVASPTLGKATPLVVDQPDAEPLTPIQADIWQADGAVVYYFNQLRGLQVLDLADPGSPQRLATLRMPAVGQDMYLLPGVPAEPRSLVLLARGSGKTLIHQVRVSDGKAELASTREVAGDLLESRMAGGRLFLLTSTPVGAQAAVTLGEWAVGADVPPVALGEVVMEGGAPVVAAGAGWLAVALTPANEWNVSAVHIFQLRPDGLQRLSAAPLRTEGQVADKFKMDWNAGVLTTISQRNLTDGVWMPATVLETWRADGAGGVPERLGRVELGQGEGLFATRFAGDKAYVVTFLRTDPLWVVDLSDPAVPVVAGHLEVPGWSSHLEAFGDLLFSIGWEGGTVAASLFDVADPAKPQLLRRFNLGAPGSFSEAAWDERALKVLPEQGLVLVPVSRFDYSTGTTIAEVQLLDLDLAGRDLRLRGSISQDFEARRAMLLGSSVVSISQRNLVTADIADRDHPRLLADVELAWPVDRIFATADHWVQIEDGGMWSGGMATVRVSPSNAGDELLNEAPLGEGEVVAASLREGKLVVVRKLGNSRQGANPWIRFAWQPEVSQTLVLDVFDASALPALPLIGSCTVDPGIAGRWKVGELLWPQANRPCLVIEAQPYPFWFWGGVVLDVPQQVVAAAAPLGGYADLGWNQPLSRQPRLLVFDLNDPQDPSVDLPIELSANPATLASGHAAAAGIVAVGVDSWVEAKMDSKPSGGRIEKLKGWLGIGSIPQPSPSPVPGPGSLALSHGLCLIDVPASGLAVMRPAIDLPGSLFAVAEFDRHGLLAFTTGPANQSGRALQVSACDGRDAFLVSAIEETNSGPVTAVGRRVFVADGQQVKVYRLDDTGRLAAQRPVDIGWQANELQWRAGMLLGTSGQRLFVSDATGTSQWELAGWGLNLSGAMADSGAGLLVPMGQYGVEQLPR